MDWRLGTLLFLIFFLCPALSQANDDFEGQVAPLLIRRCVECHQGPDASGSLDLTSRQGLQTGGDSGAVIDPEDGEASLLLQRVQDGDMPPEQQGQSQALPEQEIEVIRRWLAAGAPWPEERKLDYFERTNDVRAGRDWWSLQPLVRPTVPKGPDGESDGNPIDAFVLASLQREGIAPAPKAERGVLIRRLYFDLIGIPPTEEEIRAFRNDQRPDAWEVLVDRVLAMPQYGERWGQYWLDLARYADTSGYERDQEKPYAWKYRDWVISAWNQDMPYDRFVTYQLAGDEVADRDQSTLIATGFLRLGTWNDEPNDPEDYRYERLEDLVHTTSSATLALTVKCARCHAHKFDPIKQEDYYRMASAFWPGPLDAGRPVELLGGPSEEELGTREVLAWTDIVTDPKPLHILKNGERKHPTQPVVPGTLSAIPALEYAFQISDQPATTTRRRLQLAQWITNRDNPLFDRVIVNRLWQHHFGQAIVRTPNNFGFLADAPTHPELLDWLAVEFQQRGRSMKSMHRLILNSRTWQQSSDHPNADQLASIDPANRLWWRAERRRRDAESLRDSLLSVSRDLDLTMGGEGFRPDISAEALEGLSMKGNAWQPSPPDDQLRRSVYMYAKRGLLSPMMATFDRCDTTSSCGQRDVTTVPTQALALMNNPFVHQRSLSLARKTISRTEDLDEQIDHVWRSVLQRSPDSKEMLSAREHVSAQFQLIRESMQRLESQEGLRLATDDLPRPVLHYRADRVTMSTSGHDRIATWIDLSENGNDATQPLAESQPRLGKIGSGLPALEFRGQQFLRIPQPPIRAADCTVVVVATDQGRVGNRELISNWDGAAGNSISSFFLGFTGDRFVRFSDALRSEVPLPEPGEAFVLTGMIQDQMAKVYLNGQAIANSTSLPSRRWDTDWVIGTQGNFNAEYWEGTIGELIVYDHFLSDEQRSAIEKKLVARYGLTVRQDGNDPMPRPKVAALASLIHVLMNSNEFLYVD